MSNTSNQKLITTCKTKTDNGTKAIITTYGQTSSKVSQLTHHVHKLQKEDKASYYLYAIPYKAKLRSHDGQICNLVQIELYTINYTPRTKPSSSTSIADLLYHVDPGCDPSSFISAKLAFLVKKKKTKITLTESFFTDACLALKQCKFDNVSVKEFWMNRNNEQALMDRAIRQPSANAKVCTIIFDVSFSFAQDFISKSHARHEIHPTC